MHRVRSILVSAAVGALATGLAAGAAATAAPTDTPAPGLDDDLVPLYRTDDPSTLTDLRIAGCLSSVNAFNWTATVTVRAVAPGEDPPSGHCATSSPPPLPAGRDARAPADTNFGPRTFQNVRFDELDDIALVTCADAADHTRARGAVVSVRRHPRSDGKDTGCSAAVPLELPGTAP